MKTRESLQVDDSLVDFVELELAPAVGIAPQNFWETLKGLIETFSGENADLICVRDELQEQLDRWLEDTQGIVDPVEHRTFLQSIGYLVDEPEPSPISTGPTDAEIGHIPGPQLVVPATNARYALNAANARWGSLYDALYGTDALGTPPQGGYSPEHGARVVNWVREFLDHHVPLRDASYRDVQAFVVADEQLHVLLGDGSSTTLVDQMAFIGYQGAPDSPSAIALRHNDLHIELRIDRNHPIGASDTAGISDVQLESAISTIVDLEDSVACVDAEDKVLAYRNWLGLMTGALTAEVHKDRRFTRSLSSDREYVQPHGSPIVLAGRSLLLVRNVGLHMYTDAVLDASGGPIPEGLLDLAITTTAALVDVTGRAPLRNSGTGSIYVVKPKLHGPYEVDFFARQCEFMEKRLGLEQGTIKIGLMDEERRTSVNLGACIASASARIAFINTGFLDRTGDEIHTAMAAGPVVGKAAMRQQPWILAYEDRNVDLGLAYGFQGRAQIGKGMWAAPNRMADMLEQKINHPQGGASCAWVPSPTAATLHATHYHEVDVVERQIEITAQGARADRSDLLNLPLATSSLTRQEIQDEVDNCVQGILGYVVRWINQGIGCSTVPDINDIGLMEDRATLRISSQLLANWLRHGWIDRQYLEASFHRMIPVVNQQNSADTNYRPLSGDHHDAALQAAWSLILDGVAEPAGYTETTLHRERRAVKAALQP